MIKLENIFSSFLRILCGMQQNKKNNKLKLAKKGNTKQWNGDRWQSQVSLRLSNCFLCERCKTCTEMLLEARARVCVCWPPTPFYVGNIDRKTLNKQKPNPYKVLHFELKAGENPVLWLTPPPCWQFLTESPWRKCSTLIQLRFAVETLVFGNCDILQFGFREKSNCAL